MKITYNKGNNVNVTCNVGLNIAIFQKNHVTVYFSIRFYFRRSFLISIKIHLSENPGQKSDLDNLKFIKSIKMGKIDTIN